MRSSDLARSFLVTVALSGCSGSGATFNPPPPDPDPEPTVSVVVEDGPPTGGTGGRQTTDEVFVPQPTATGTPSAVRGRVTKQDGGCLWLESAVCDPGERCNPPPPRAIVCPAIGEPLLDQIRERRSDGTCILVEEPPPPQCPPNRACNPPAPMRREVACPDA